MAFPKDYADPIRKTFGYNAVWEIGVKVKVGDYGIVHASGRNKSTFDRVGNINKDFPAVTMNIQKSKRIAVESIQTDGVSVLEATGSASDPEKSVKVDVKFSKKYSCLYHGSGMVIHQIKDQVKFGQTLYKQKGWKRRWYVVTSIHKVESAMYLLSQSKGSSISLTGNANLGTANLADASAGINFTNTSGAILNLLLDKPHAPMVRVRKVRRKGMKLAEEDPSKNMNIDPSNSLSLDDDTEFAEIQFDYCEMPDLASIGVRGE